MEASPIKRSGEVIMTPIEAPSGSDCDVSIIIPAHNEEESVAHLHQQIVDAMGQSAVAWQVVYVDDGSTDQTFQILDAIAQRDPRAVVVQLRRNFGQTAAIAAGIDHSSGTVIALLDADMQNDPADIPRLLEKLDEGYDLVSGWRRNRQDAFWNRRLPSIVANSLISAVTGVRLHDYGCTLKVYRRDILEHVQLYGEMHRLIPAYAGSVGARIAEMPVNHRGRRFGRSKYGMARTMKVLLDLLTTKFLSNYVTKPIYLFGGSGLGLAFIGFLLTAVVAVEKIFYGIWVHRNPLAWIAGFSFVSALQLMLMGLLAEMTVRIYHESQRKPTYLVRRVVNRPEDTVVVRHIRVRR
ncbi:MAG TPA: glycosyltransferase family 2 protein [bacterium]|nr:glycosyltransferase family 2 protein [bacterium]